MTPIILASPLKYENNKANTLNTKVFNDTDAFQQIYIDIYIFIKKIYFFIIQYFYIIIIIKIDIKNFKNKNK